MTTKAITYDDEKQQLVPKKISDDIDLALYHAVIRGMSTSEIWVRSLNAAPSPVEQFCEWKLCEGSNVHATGCGELAHTVTHYCHNCGKPIKEVKP